MVVCSRLSSSMLLVLLVFGSMRSSLGVLLLLQLPPHLGSVLLSLLLCFCGLLVLGSLLVLSTLFILIIHTQFEDTCSSFEIPFSIFFGNKDLMIMVFIMVVIFIIIMSRFSFIISIILHGLQNFSISCSTNTDCNIHLCTQIMRFLMALMKGAVHVSTFLL